MSTTAETLSRFRKELIEGGFSERDADGLACEVGVAYVKENGLAVKFDA
ncbi:hypothetical protein QM716_28420 [Rhodococcus sp. IEGM 1409]|nr:hypothetical protein [Rhodococcus sp. IEGM 1409]MDI9903795.1 hypothetical protein [Rhodococcus sp. IEGM 1409]